MIAKETEHFPRRVRSSRIGIGSGGTAAPTKRGQRSGDTPVIPNATRIGFRAMRGKITKRSVGGLAAGDLPEVVLWDTEIKGFGVRARSSGARRLLTLSTRWRS